MSHVRMKSAEVYKRGQAAIARLHTAREYRWTVAVQEFNDRRARRWFRDSLPVTNEAARIEIRITHPWNNPDQYRYTDELRLNELCQMAGLKGTDGYVYLSAHDARLLA